MLSFVFLWNNFFLYFFGCSFWERTFATRTLWKNNLGFPTSGEKMIWQMRCECLQQVDSNFQLPSSLQSYLEVFFGFTWKSAMVSKRLTELMTSFMIISCEQRKRRSGNIENLPLSGFFHIFQQTRESLKRHGEMPLDTFELLQPNFNLSNHFQHPN